MQKRRLGKTDIEVSMIGLGTVKFGRNQGVKYPHAFSLPTEKEIEQLLAQAAELGINLLDTAAAYGASEERLGKILQCKRRDWVICTKAGEDFNNGESHFDFTPRGIQQSVERSLQRLKTDYLDIVLIHSDGDDVRLIEEEHVLTTLSALKKDGKIRAFGMSTKTVAGGMLTVDLADVAMVTFNPEYMDEREVIAHALKKQKGVLVKKALASGHLRTPASAAMQMVVSEPGVTSVVVGTLNAAHLAELVG